MAEIPFKDSFWADEVNPEPAPPLQGDTRADVVVIGAGIVGLSCAYYLRKEGLDVVLLERKHVGYASSGRNFGVLTPTIGPWVGDWGGFYDSDLWRKLHAWLQNSVDEAEQLLASEEISCEFKRRPLSFVALQESDVDELKRNVERQLDMGTPARFLNAEDMGELVTFKTFGGMALDGSAAVQPWQMVRGYRQLALQAGVRLHEETPVESMLSGTQVVLRTPQGAVTADKAVMAMNAYSGQFGFMYKYIMPRYGYAIATEPLDEKTAAAVGLPDDDTFLDVHAEGGRGNFYQRFRSDRRLLCGGTGPTVGSRQAMGAPELMPAQGYNDSVASLRAEMVRRYPVLSDIRVESAWGGATCTTSTFLPVFCEDPEEENVIVALVANGRGMIGVGTGHLVKGLVLGKDKLDESTRTFLDACVGPHDADPRILEDALTARIDRARIDRDRR